MYSGSPGRTVTGVCPATSGRTPAGMDNFTPPRGLKPGRGFKSEAHLVVRRHGRPRLGAVAIQTGTFEPHEALGGACPDAECFDQFAFVFQPME